MDTSLNPAPSIGIHIGTSMGSISDWLRRITVGIGDRRQRLGSGVIWNPKGLVVTNAHVVARRKGFHVALSGGRRTEARLLACEPSLDLAALRIDLVALPAAFPRSAGDLRAGELVMAAGNPWDGEGAISTGILHRAGGRGPCILADIRLAPGNSRGPLADARGNIIGINSAVIGGLGCAISSDTVDEFLRHPAIREAA